jgi:hypothetical protein
MKSKLYFENNRAPELTAAEERTARRSDRRMCRTYRLIITNHFRFIVQVAEGYKIQKHGKDYRKK